MSGTDRIDGAARTPEPKPNGPMAKELEKLREIGVGFEEVFTNTLLGELLKPLAGAGLGGSGPGASVLEGLLQQHLSSHVAKSGGFGLGRMVEESMKSLLTARRMTTEELDQKLKSASGAAVAPDLHSSMEGRVR